MSIIKTYAYKGITVDAVQINNRRMSEADRADLNAWLDKHDVNVTIDTEFTYGIESSTAISVETPDYAFYMNPGDWLAHDGDIFFHITDKVFREHYREVTDEDDVVVYATGGVLNSATGIDMYQFIPPAWRTRKPANGLDNIDKYPPIDGLISVDKLPPAYLLPEEWHDCPRPRKRRGGATMGAAYLDGVEIVTGGKAVHHPVVDAIRKAQAKAKAKAKADEIRQQAKETNRETYDRHLKLLDNDGHADQCDYCNDTSRNMIPLAHNKALADAVDKQLADMERRRGAVHLHMDRDGKVTPARRLREELERQWHHTHTTKTTPRTRADEWKVPLEILAMYYNQFPPTVDTEKEDADHHTPGSGTIRLHNGITVTTKDGTRAYVHAKELTRLSNGDIEITGPRFTVGYTAEAYISCNYLNAYGAIRTITSPAPGSKETEGMGEKEREAVDRDVFGTHCDNLRSCLDVIRQLTVGNGTIQALVRQANNNLDVMQLTTPTPTTGPEATND